MFDLTASRNVAVINMNGVDFELYYRNPTTEEMVGFQGEGMVRKGNKIINRLVFARVKYGAAVITGFKAGLFAAEGKPVSADPQDKKEYRKDWKELLVQGAPQLVAAVGQVVFEGVRVGGADAAPPLEFVSEIAEAETPASGADGPAEGEAPLAKN